MNTTARTTPQTDTDLPVFGSIKSVQGPTPGPSDEISYTVLVRKPGGGVVEVAGVVPMNQRPTAADIDAATPGTMVLGFLSGGVYYFQIIEQYASGGCDDAAALAAAKAKAARAKT